MAHATPAITPASGADTGEQSRREQRRPWRNAGNVRSRLKRCSGPVDRDIDRVHSAGPVVPTINMTFVFASLTGSQGRLGPCYRPPSRAGAYWSEALGGHEAGMASKKTVKGSMLLLDLAWRFVSRNKTSFLPGTGREQDLLNSVNQTPRGESKRLLVRRPRHVDTATCAAEPASRSGEPFGIPMIESNVLSDDLALLSLSAARQVDLRRKGKAWVPGVLHTLGLELSRASGLDEPLSTAFLHSDPLTTEIFAKVVGHASRWRISLRLQKR